MKYLVLAFILVGCNSGGDQSAQSLAATIASPIPTVTVTVTPSPSTSPSPAPSSVGNNCTTLSQQMSFSGYAAYLDSANLFAGNQYGSQLSMAQGGAVSGNQFVNTIMPPSDNYAPRSTSDLSYMGLNMTSASGSTGVLPTGSQYTGLDPGSPGTSTQTMIQGSFQFSAADWAYLTSMFQYSGYNGQYGTYPATSPTTLENAKACDLSINTGLYPWNTSQGQGTLFKGVIYLTINGQVYSFQI